jgi:hypothetical protein
MKMLEDGTKLRSVERADVDGILVELKQLCSKRSAVLDDFARGLEAIEIERAQTVHKHLKTMVDSMIQIAHKLPAEVERIAEPEANELNGVLIKNIVRCSSFLLFKSSSSAVDNYVEASRQWLVVRQAGWFSSPVVQ